MDPDGSLLRALEATTHRLGIRVQAALADLGLDQAQAHVLSLLATSPALTVGAIHAAFGHRPSTVTDVLDRLERRGLVARSVNPSDRRSVIVRLTPAGEAAAKRVLAFDRGIERGLAERLGNDGVVALKRGLTELEAILAPEQARRRTAPHPTGESRQDRRLAGGPRASVTRGSGGERGAGR